MSRLMSLATMSDVTSATSSSRAAHSKAGHHSLGDEEVYYSHEYVYDHRLNPQELVNFSCLQFRPQVYKIVD